MSLLDEIIDGSSDGAVTTGNLLRKVQVAGVRLGAQEVVQWAKNELSGYPEDSPKPAYRKLQSPVRGTFSGPMRSSITRYLQAPPEGHPLAGLFKVELGQPLEELQALSEGKHDPGLDWPPTAVRAYEESGIFRLEFHELFSAHCVLTRQFLRGLIDTVRNNALEFALELEGRFPDAGSRGGPTVQSDPELRSCRPPRNSSLVGKFSPRISPP
jgi:hypothetical protein